MIVQPSGMPFHHVGILVEDLDEASEEFGRLLGITFGEPREVVLEASDGNDYPVFFTYSVQGPPFIELIVAMEHGPWSRALGLGVHHIGFERIDLEPTLTRLETLSDDPATVFRRLGELRAAYLDPTLAANVRVELMCPIANVPS